MLARKESAELGLSFEEVFQYQYVICRRGIDPQGMKVSACRGWRVLTGNALPVARLHDGDGIFIGLLLGIAAGPDGLIEGDYCFGDLSAGVPEFFSGFERHLNAFAGRFTIIVASGGDERIYCDPVGMLGVVYNPQTRRVGSSLKLCIEDAVQDHPLYDHSINEAYGSKYSLFHTRDARVRRMNPSFYLDLANFHENRYWPRADSFDMPEGGLEAVYDELINTARHSIGAIAARYDCAMPLSGGRDSRLLAAFAGPHMQNIRQVFTHVTNYATRIDAEIARRLAALMEVEHEVHDRRKIRPVPRRVRRNERCFHMAAGAVLPLPSELASDVNQCLTPGSVVLRGHQTDLLRAVFVRKAQMSHWKDFRWQIEKLLIVPRNHFNDEVYTRFMPEFMAWHRTLSPVARSRAVDMMFLEVYYASSLGMTFPGLHRHFYMSPFNSRRMIELSLSIDVTYRIGAKPVDDLLYRMNPDLLSVPFDNEISADLSNIDGPSPARDLRVAAALARALAQASAKSVRKRRA
jgi:hypothetical protein